MDTVSSADLTIREMSHCSGFPRSMSDFYFNAQDGSVSHSIFPNFRNEWYPDIILDPPCASPHPFIELWTTVATSLLLPVLHFIAFSVEKLPKCILPIFQIFYVNEWMSDGVEWNGGPEAASFDM